MSKQGQRDTHHDTIIIRGLKHGIKGRQQCNG